MDKTFLELVAEDLINKNGTNLSHIAVVFPNKRAALFMNEYLARYAQEPVWSPKYITISELFRKHTNLKAGDPIKLICELHKSFTKCTGINESLDHFYGWGQLLLADFDDIDKNMADADKIFCNLKDIHELDDISYLNEEQKEMLKRFFANFSDNHETELKKRFISLWSHFSDIYHDYNQRLLEQGISYEGAIYRTVASAKDTEFMYEKYIFVGFNLLQKVEHALFTKLRKEGKAKFYWDFDKYYMNLSSRNQNKTNLFRLKEHEAGHYISSYLADFPNEIDTSSDIYDNMVKPKNIRFISSPTENAQARYVSRWLEENGRYKDGRKTAVVMCDESILLPVMHSMPDVAQKVNITSGFPLGMTPVASLVLLLLDLYSLGMRKDGKQYNQHYKKKLLAHPYAQYIQDKYLSFACEKGHPDYNILLLRQISEMVKCVGINSKDVGDALMQESVFRMFTILNRLVTLVDDGDLIVDVTTLRRLISQLISTSTIPFHGEPVVGIQIMGVLETRNLDFDHILLLSCNEGNMPKGVNDLSFIPYSIRKAHGLTTIDNKVAIYSYYFYRLLQRAKDITIMYNNTTDNGHTSEMSRFMLQLLVESGHNIKHYNLIAQNIPVSFVPKSIDKNKEINESLDKMKTLSPSAINTFIRCKLAFYYQYIAHIKEPDADIDTIDNRMFGNIFHRSAYLVYEDITKRYEEVKKEHIQAYLKNKQLLASVVDRAFEEEFLKDSNSNVHKHYNGLQIINRQVIIEYLSQLLRIDERMAPFKILGMEDEAKVYTELMFAQKDGTERSIGVGGVIDRLDMIEDRDTGKKLIRVVDYKTGYKPSSSINSVEEIFDENNIRTKHSNYYLQAILYSLIVDESEEWNKNKLTVSPALLFIKQTNADDYDPILCIGKHKIKDVGIYREEFLKRLREIITDIFSSETSFTPTADKHKCEVCTYRKLCGL